MDFNPLFSTKEIYRDEDMTHCIEDDLLGIEETLPNKAPLNHTHSTYATTNHTHSEYAATSHAHSEYAVTSHTHSYNNLTDKPTIPTIPSSLPANGGNADTVDNKHASDFADADHVHGTTPLTEVVDLNNVTASGVYSFAVAYAPTNRPTDNSNGWLVVLPWSTDLNTQTIKQVWLRHGTIGSNDHEIYVRTKVGDYGWSTWAKVWTTKDMTITNGDGDVFVSWTGQDVVAKFTALDSGMYTAYSRGGTSAGTTNAPNTNEGWRYLMHKTGSSPYGWIIAFGTSGSFYVGYLNSGTWTGWRRIVDANPPALWTGSLYVKSTQTVTPSKKLSECCNGWILMWSDYDESSSTANDGDIVTSVIYKKGLSGGNWSGESHYFDVPRYICADSATDTSVEKRIMKRLYVYDNRLVGHDSNTIGDRTDVVLRAVYEF